MGKKKNKIIIGSVEINVHKIDFSKSMENIFYFYPYTAVKFRNIIGNLSLVIQ